LGSQVVNKDSMTGHHLKNIGFLLIVNPCKELDKNRSQQRGKIYEK